MGSPKASTITGENITEEPRSEYKRCPKNKVVVFNNFPIIKSQNRRSTRYFIKA